MDFFLNKTEIENNNIKLSFKIIKSFEELIKCNLDEIIYIDDSDDEYPKRGIRNQVIKRKKTFFGNFVYFKLNDIALEPTRVGRDNFNNCGKVFYKMELNLDAIYTEGDKDEN